MNNILIFSAFTRDQTDNKMALFLSRQIFHLKPEELLEAEIALLGQKGQLEKL